ncbi:PREDICTED: uncharacterized protein LOC105501949 [Colobus angolensis palliatus]|uniref:uncharacterized protein LOC105501949 n=1 Tax=Colobus angolensis palliatus TaxID=336983 RepID=UPI0005F47F6F|nr:PREDICTED: uncharacterized protein LOC105501949 [Colobus angolensis palliatus]
MFCRTSANFGIAYPLPILGKVLLLVDPSEGRAWCTWAVLPSSAWVMNKRAVVWPESWGRLGRALDSVSDLGSGRALTLGRGEPLSHRPSSLTLVLHGAAASHGPWGSQSSWLEPRPLVPNREGHLQIRFGPPGVSVDSECPGGEGRGERGILASRINAWNIGQRHGHLETLSCASAKPGNF